MLQPINKHTVLKQVRTNGTWHGFIAPSRVNSSNIKDGWCVGMGISIKFEDGKYLTENSDGDYVELETVLNEFEYYNCNSDLGNSIRFWN